MKKMLMDVDNSNFIPGVYATTEDGSRIEVIPAGKMMNPIPSHEQNNSIYRLLENHSKLVFLTQKGIEEFDYYPVPMISFFAYDLCGNYYGTIGGIGDLGSDEYPIGYINRNGAYGKAAKNIRSFLELVIYYPDWQKIMASAQADMSCIRNDDICTISDEDSKHLSNQKEIIDILKIERNPDAIEQFMENLHGEAGFMVYQSIEDARKAWDFLEIDINQDQEMLKSMVGGNRDD